MESTAPTVVLEDGIFTLFRVDHVNAYQHRVTLTIMPDQSLDCEHRVEVYGPETNGSLARAAGATASERPAHINFHSTSASGVDPKVARLVSTALLLAASIAEGLRVPQVQS